VKLRGLRLAHHPLHNGTTKFDLSMDVLELPEGLLCSLEYSLDAFDEAGATRPLERFTEILAAIAADPSVMLSRLLPSISPAASISYEAWAELTPVPGQSGKDWISSAGKPTASVTLKQYRLQVKVLCS
jgi:hypothetical protein